MTSHSASIALLYAGTVLLVQRKDGTWCFPGGRGEEGERPLQTARREFREEVEANAYNVQPYSFPWTPSMEITGPTPNGNPHTLFVWKVDRPPTVTGVQETELLGWEWAKPSSAVLWSNLHHGVEGNLREMIENPRLFTV